MIPLSLGPRTAALRAACALGALLSPLAAQCPPPPLPLTHAPIAGIDPLTVVLGSFDESLAVESSSGSLLVKTNYALVEGQGLFGSGAMRVRDKAVAIYPLPSFDAASGSFEFWFRPSADTTSRQVLFSLRGASSLNGDRYTDLVVGETPSNSTAANPGTSNIYFGKPWGIDPLNPARLDAVAVRGLAYADVDGNGKNDLIVSDNLADNLQHPATTTPGELHIYSGPIKPKQLLVNPSAVIELDMPQGLVAVDVDQDGDADITATSFNPATVALWGFVNDGAGGFTPSYGPVGSEFITSAEGVASADVNKDDVADFLYGSFSLSDSYMLFGMLANGVYSLPTDSAVARSDQTLGVDLGDVDGDGWLDAVLAQPLYDNGPNLPSGRLAIHLNDGAGSYAAIPDVTVTTPRPFTVHAGKDIDNDGYIDIVVANWRNGPLTVDHSSVYLGPITAGVGSSAQLDFRVDDAVSMAIGDFNDDGIDDIFFHSATASASPVFLLDENGRGTNGVDSSGCFLPNYTLPTQPTVNNPAGEGAGVMAAGVGGTSAYGTTRDRSNSFEIRIENGQIHFDVYDRRGRLHSVTAPLPPVGDPDTVNGFHHLQAEWWPIAGLLELRIGHPDRPGNLYQSISPLPFNVSAVAPVFRIGSDCDNQAHAVGWLIDDLRISSVRRSQIDADLDGFEDGWDNCLTTANADQLDSDNDGVGDACVTCQPDLGLGGPGNVTISLCGQPLCAGTSPTFLLSGAQPLATGLLFAGLAANPTAFKGGTLLPVPWVYAAAIQVDASGQLQFPLPGGANGLGPLTVFVQAVLADPAQLLGAALSNALQADFL